ncbi:unnamed protein product [Zymoseptoria tritici ST99CH_1E4]|uniref:RhoGAP-domain-containing protein n=1 Tax=Zymoseptoria tritici ST99CH_1E4 TaxID=1276532 RepID=A0A2H1H036_ZYMTR|nr:unnamed protein product [Zymoseptoria tritici ST99CH_1E4]
MESPGAYPESPTEQDDVVYPCKGCGEILEEGKAFELAGNRWHIDCFRCNTCGTLLDSDANLLLLGDGSLICNNCTYSCNACGNKIEDLAILTGDQAFCSGCFRCRNCKRKIENLRYARTSQGIFCMSCHESLMARRRKKARTPKAAAGSSGAPEKALPSLPPGAAHSAAFTPDLETPPGDKGSGTPSTQPASPRDRLSNSRNGASANGPTLPASTYNEVRPSNAASPSTEDEDGSEQGFLPMAFDPTPVAAPQLSIPRKQIQRPHDPSPPVQKENQPVDYFGRNGRLSASSALRNGLKEESGFGSGTAASSRSVSTEREQERAAAKPSPHVLQQDKGRHSTKNTPALSGGSPLVSNGQDKAGKSRVSTDTFTLQEAPKAKKGSSRRNSKGGGVSPIDTQSKDPHANKPVSPLSADSQNSVNPFDEPRHKAGQHPAAGSPAVPVPPPRSAERGLPARGDSLATAAAAATRLQQATHDSSLQATSGHERNKSTGSIKLQLADPQRPRMSADGLPLRSANRPSAPSKSVANDDFITPRHAPPPPAGERHRHNDSISTLQSEDRPSIDGHMGLHGAGLPKYSLDGGFSMDDEMGRILRGEQSQEPGQTSSPSVLRRVSNAVKHGRSFSDRAATTTKSPNADSSEISSPSITSPTSADGLESLRTSLRRAQNHIAELESEKLSLQDKLDGSSEIKAVNNELNAKRNTMAFLDTQREMVVRELEIMTEHLSKAKDNNQPLDLASLKTSILKDFAESLQKLKQNMSSEIEDLMHKRSELTDEIGNLIQMKDKGFQEYETLSSKNAQLVHHNNELLRNIQGVYQDNRVANGADKSTNGLGIFHPSAKVETPGSQSEMRNLNLVNTDPSMPNLLHDTEAEPAAVLTAPQVVNIRKGAKPNKFNWRRGGEKITGTLTKGIKGAFVNNEKGQGNYSIGMPYNNSHQAVGGSDGGSMHSGKMGSDFGLFPQKNGGATHLKNNSSSNLVIGNDPSVLFGSELSARCAFEKLPVPSIVTHCITQVEARGISVEGVYRKSGGAGQVKIVQTGFEKDANYDISDEDLDIHAVTSALKQYFRKLPTPLITYDVYDLLLEAGQVGKDGGAAGKEKQTLALRAAVDELPEAHRVTLRTLVRHLTKVMAYEPQNLMTPLNLAVVFAPTIMRPLSIEREMTDMQSQRTAVQAMLELSKGIFEEGE